MEKDKLTDKQQRFCEEYLIDLNATRAAKRAGYSEATANEQGSRLLANVSVHARIAEMKAERSQKLSIDSDWVLRRLKSISDRCMQAEPVMVFSPVYKAMVHKEDDEGNKLYLFDSTGANRSTEMIGKHIGFFEKDNEQGKPAMIIPEIRVYTGAPPLSNSEKEVDI